MKNSNLLLLLISIIAFFVVGVILFQLRVVLLPFVIALLLSNIFKPVVMSLKRRGVPTALSLAVVLLSFALVLSIVGVIVYSSAQSVMAEAPKYQARLDHMVTDLEFQLAAWSAKYELPLDDLIDRRQLVSITSVTRMLGTGVGSFLSFLSNTFLVLLFMLFILAGSGDLAKKIQAGFNDRQASRIASIVQNVDAQVRRYLVTKTLISLVTGVITATLLWLIGVDFPLFWGFLAFLLNFIPNIGSLMAVVFPLVLSLLQFDGALQPLLVLALLGTSQAMMGSVIEPRVMATSLNLSALVVLVSLIFWGWLWGIWGMILAVPLSAAIKILFENVAALQPVAVLMSGPVETA